MVALSAVLDGIPAVSDLPAPLVWVLHDGKAGMASQALGLAEATGFRFVEKRLSARRPWAWLPPQLWIAPLRAVSETGVALAPPWPDLVIGCGRHTAMPALAIRRASDWPGCRRRSGTAVATTPITPTSRSPMRCW